MATTFNKPQEFGGGSNSSGVGTFSSERELPKLPLPDLKQSLQELKESLKPLYYADGYYKHPLDPEQLKNLSNDISIFEESEAAHKLQGKLDAFHQTNDCYLDNLHLDINNSYAKGGLDDVLPRNPFLVLADDAVPDITQADRSAVLVHSALRFISALKSNVLPLDHNSRNGEPLSMFPYLNLFGTTRCPVFDAGEVESFDLEKPYTDSDLENGWSSSSSDLSDTEDSLESLQSRRKDNGGKNDIFKRHGISLKRYTDSKHILVISRGQYYTIDVLDENNNITHDVSSLITIFNYILSETKGSSVLKKSTALGSLTSHSFKNWKYARKRLQKKYPDELLSIDSSLFVLVLDESADNDNETEEGSSLPTKGLATSSSDCKRLFYGTSVIDEKGHQVGSCISRWYDKLQLVVTADSKAAVIWDSFTCDGSVVLRFISETYTESVLRLARDVNAGDPRFSLWPSVKDCVCIKDSEIDPSTFVSKIDWDFSNILNTHVHLSETKLADLISKHDIIHVSVPFGRRSAQRLGISPDSMIQVALQVAHYALYGRMVYGFEPVSTRRFRKSRSCFINIQSQDLLELCQLFISNSFDGNGKLEKFVYTCERHTEKIRRAKENGGYEKHFNALRYLFKFHDHYGIDLDSKDKQVCVNIFENPLVKPFSAPELIVANCGNAATTTFGVTPAVPQGFGIGYIIKDDQCDITVTSQFRQGDRLMFMLNWVLQEIRNFWKKSRLSSYNKTGVKISPLVDKLYEMDNALNSIRKSNEQSSSSKVIKGYGFFDLQAHIDSRSTSRVNSQSNSFVQLQDLANNSQTNLSINKSNPLFSSNHSSSAISVPTDKEKQNTGYQIRQIHPETASDEEVSPTSTTSSSEAKKRSNVINSKFEIDFDRSGVGRKVQAAFE